MKVAKLLIPLLIMLAALSPSLIRPAQAAGQVTLNFYDRTGAQLNVSQIRSTSNNGTAGYDNDALLNPSTLEVISMGPLITSGTTLAFTVPSQAVALAFNWPTQPRGYSLIILDNGGAGFTGAATVNFTYQAALDEKRRLDAALAARPDYVQSSAFQTAYNSAVAHITTANGSGSQSVKGSEGQLALDQLAVAYDTLLSEYGPAYAHAHLATQTPWLGVTIDTVTNYQANLDLAASLTQPYGWVRVVFDLGKGPSDYDALIRYAKNKGLKVMGQPVDSSWDTNYTRAQYKQRFIDFLTYYNGTTAPALDAWEVGNEVNGSWLSSAIANKVADAAAEVRSRQPGAKTVLTLFWQINTDTKATAMFNWANANLPAATMQNIDVITVSQYIEQAPMGLAFDQVMSRLQANYPGKQIALGELGYWIPGQQYWWAFNQTDPTGAGLRGVAGQYYPASFAYPSSVGGVFWWNFITEFSGDTQLQAVVSGLRDKLVGTGGPTPTPTSTPTTGPTPTPSPTLTPTNTPTFTPTPTATFTPTPTPTSGGGNTHGGTWAAKGTLPATANFKDLYQDNLSVSTNTSYTASLWIKGSGSVRLNIWNGTWATNLGNVQCTAGGAWAQCSLTVNSGSRTKFVYDIESFYNGPGTVYIDDTFLGVSGGSNLLGNPGFESGNTIWQNTSTAVWSIVQNP